ncbi:hypothetical protein H6F86_05920 [Phormidium sp. FACHB-592]|jgi:SMC interacting uncharacterized protein involved in chromosome segregation|uniref:Uncharacterized protein n=1 Tax=Stenomitos frigidus AS-A4 TaxID=2933935 RepID=A0ABV0KQY4_9CYAN|nr:hypothetical protein [Phormidium sp. FACHB-592]MBD2073429.1 hypothetical protein [Phormidium sp. FACHB-592]
MARDSLTITLETLTDFAAQHQMNLLKIDESMKELVAEQTKLTANVNKLGDKIDLLSQVVNSQQITAQSQSENIAALIAVVNNLVVKN